MRESWGGSSPTPCSIPIPKPLCIRPGNGSPDSSQVLLNSWVSWASTTPSLDFHFLKVTPPSLKSSCYFLLSWIASQADSVPVSLTSTWKDLSSAWEACAWVVPGMVYGILPQSYIHSKRWCTRAIGTKFQPIRPFKSHPSTHPVLTAFTQMTHYVRSRHKECNHSHLNQAFWKERLIICLVFRRGWWGWL